MHRSLRIMNTCHQDWARAESLIRKNLRLRLYLFATLTGSSIKRIVDAKADMLVRVSPNATDGGLLRSSPPSARANDKRRLFTPVDLVSDTVAEPLGSRVRFNPSNIEEIIINLNVRDTTRETSRIAVVRQLRIIRDALRRQLSLI